MMFAIYFQVVQGKKKIEIVEAKVSKLFYLGKECMEAICIIPILLLSVKTTSK